MIKAFLFDWGGVMSLGGKPDEMVIRLSSNLDISYEESNNLLKVVWKDYVRGKITEDELWHSVERLYGKPIPQTERDIWNVWQNTSTSPKMYRLVEELKKSGYRVGLVSNTIPKTANDILSHGGYDIFDFKILSYEVGFAKPDPEIYQLAMDKLSNILPEEMIFIDDQKKCLSLPEELGMFTILARSPDQVIKDAKDLIES
jgi:putative hydrolase of the HAD superfamily